MKRKILCLILSMLLIATCMSGCVKVKVGSTSSPTVENSSTTMDGFGAGSEFTGLYEVTGHMSSTFGSNRTLKLSLTGVDNENSGDFDASETTIPTYITDYTDNIYLQLTFNEKGLEDWHVVDKITMTDLKQPSEDELSKQLFPEVQYEQVPAGDLPTEILLSKYSSGKTYVFDIPNPDTHQPFPNIINDTTSSVMIVSTKMENDEKFDRQFKTNQVIKDTSISVSSFPNGNSKMYIAIIESTPEVLLKTNKHVLLSECTVGSNIDFSFEDYIYNDTDKTVTLSSSNEQYVLQPKEVIACSWMNTVKVESIG